MSDVLPISSTLINTCVLWLCRFLCPPWQNVALESKELMSACLRKIPGLSKVCHITVSVHTLKKRGGAYSSAVSYGSFCFGS